MFLLEENLAKSFTLSRPDIVFYVAGVDVVKVRLMAQIILPS